MFVHSECSIHSPLIRYATRNRIIIKNCRTTISRQKGVELALNISILVAYKLNGREKCSSIKTQKGVQSRTSVRYIFAKAIEIHAGLWYNKSKAKVVRFQLFSLLCVTTLLTTV